MRFPEIYSPHARKKALHPLNIECESFSFSSWLSFQFALAFNVSDHYTLSVNVSKKYYNLKAPGLVTLCYTFYTFVTRKPLQLTIQYMQAQSCVQVVLLFNNGLDRVISSERDIIFWDNLWLSFDNVFWLSIGEYLVDNLGYIIPLSHYHQSLKDWKCLNTW